ncbi:peptidase [Nocardiopsis sp. CNR-923]|uniref:alpha/beta fold hydrolase n=1 Tax=Nocardiopsis sp. CNR-923 TaxID=1904965 RepID=UPI000962A341|nr:alpha/beta fold hydrolase [Nocardiopsis sp. CNR-923]OLT28126.1 peptidase [Nocardiopsis sp. CNR-923]
MRRRIRATVTAGALLASLVGVPVPALADTARPATRVDRTGLDWGPCKDLEPSGDEVLECATLTVPLVRTAGGDRVPGADETVELALSRVRATGTTRHTLIVNPGGPGSGARRWASMTHGRMPEELREVYDVVAFDPRGVGASTPAITCDPDYFTPVRPDTVPADGGEEAVLRADARAYARACAENTGRLLSHTRTEDTAHDMDAVRRALGEERIDYLGYSYGSYLGTVYSSLYPDRVRSLVLDSVVNPDNPWYESNHVQSRALQRAAQHFFDWAARHHATYRLGRTGDEVAEAYYRLRSELRADPIEATVGPTELETAVLVVAYAESTWPGVARALSAWINDGDDTGLLTLHRTYGDHADSDRSYGGYLAVQCTDAHWPTDWSAWRTDARMAHEEAPFVGWHNAWYNAPCLDWGADSGNWYQVGDAPHEHRAFDGPALIVHASGDGATPVEGAHTLRDRLPGSVLVMEEGGHTHGVAFTGNMCVDEIVAAYLLHGSLPVRRASGPDVACESRAEPRPSSRREDLRAATEGVAAIIADLPGERG